MKLTERERKLATILSIAFGIVIIYYCIISPLSNLKSDLKNSVQNSQGTYAELSNIQNNLNELKEKRQKIEAIVNDKNDNIISIIRQIVAINNLTPNLTDVKSSPANVQNKMKKIVTTFKIEGANIQQLIKTVYDIENNEKMIRIESLNISKGLKGTDKYDLRLKLNTFMAE